MNQNSTKTRIFQFQSQLILVWEYHGINLPYITPLRKYFVTGLQCTACDYCFILLKLRSMCIEHKLEHKLVWGSIRSSLTYCLGPPFRLTKDQCWTIPQCPNQCPNVRTFENVQQVQSSLHTYFCMFPIYVCIMN